MKLTCVCGYSVDDGQHKIENVVYYQSGKRKGEVKRVDEVWEDVDKDKPRFIEIK